MQTNELRRPLVEQLVRAHKNKRITTDELYQKAAVHGFDQEAVDAMLPKENAEDKPQP